MGVIARQSIKGAMANYLGVAIGFVTTFFVLTRMLTTEEVGLTRVMVDAAMLFSAIAQLGTNASIVRFFPWFKESKNAHHGFFGLAMLLPMVGFVIVGTVLVAFRGRLTEVYSVNSPLLTDYFGLLPMLIFFALYLTVFETCASVLMRITVPRMVREVGIRVFNLVAYLLYGYRLITLDAFVWMFCGSYGLAMLLGLFYLLKIEGFKLGIFRVDWGYLRGTGMVRDMVRYTLFMTATVLAGSVPLLGSLFLGAKAGLALTGVYTIAFFIANVVEVPYRSLGAISRPVIATAVKEGNWAEVNRLGRQVSLHQMMVSLLIFYVIWINLDTLFTLIPNGEDYRGGATVVLILGLAKALNSSLSIGTDILNFSRYYSRGLVFIAVLTASALIFNNTLIGVWSINGAALATLLSYVLYYTLLLAFIGKRLRVSLFSGAQLKTAAIMIVAFALNWGWSRWVSPLIGTDSILPMLVDAGLKTVMLTSAAAGAMLAWKVSPTVNSLLKVEKWMSGRLEKWKGKGLIVVLLVGAWASADGQSACPGFKNPTSFSTADTRYYWSARVGERVNPSWEYDTTTGYYIMSTCPSAPEIRGSSITSSTYYTGSSGMLGGCNETYFDANDKRFQIITPENAGMDEFTVTGPGTGMPRIPPGYMTSIRLGNMCESNHVASSHTYDPTSSNKSAEALYYNMWVTSENALLIINYAVVARRYPHTAYDAGEFLIRVVAQNEDGSWPNEPIDDSLWYKVSAPQYGTGASMPAGWLEGATHGAWPCLYAYKPWTSVAISLNNYLYTNVRIEMYTSKCIYNVDPIYAYISGDYRSMTIQTTGCPAPESDVVDTLTAPVGMLSYKWYVSERGAESNIFDGNHMDTVPFRALTEEDTINMYTPVVSDFVLSRGPNAGDTVGEQTFMCVMTSALDPNKPMHSKLYANVTLQRPLIEYSMEGGCDTTVHFHNMSRSFTSGGLEDDSTYWVVYSDTTFVTALDTLWGDNPSYHFARPGYYGVKLNCMTSKQHCTADKKFFCYAKGGNDLAFTLESDQICEGDELHAKCSVGCELDKHWYINNQESGDEDSLTLTLPVGTYDIVLKSINSDGCTTTVKKKAYVLGKPVLSIGSDVAMICLGDSVTIEAEGNVSYRWVSTPHDNSLGNGHVGSSATVRPTKTTTYTLTPASYSPCYNGDASITIEVMPYPTLHVETDRPVLSVDNNTLAVTDLSDNHTHTFWTFDDGTTAIGSHHVHRYDNLMGVDSVCIGMVSCNSEKCCIDTDFCVTVRTFSIWFPNAFTPGREENSRFSAISNITPAYYEIAIYNRLGLLVYASNDITEGWDGKNRAGVPCPQGAYTYHYRYAKNNTDAYYEGSGTVTLIR